VVDPLGRRFRALKLWFLLRGHGLEDLRTMIRNHVRWSQALARRFAAEPGFCAGERTYPIAVLVPARSRRRTRSRCHNLALLAAINDDGRLYLTQTRVDGCIAIVSKSARCRQQKATRGSPSTLSATSLGAWHRSGRLPKSALRPIRRAPLPGVRGLRWRRARQVVRRCWPSRAYFFAASFVHAAIYSLRLMRAL
jgi:hypothetical protein